MNDIQDLVHLEQDFFDAGYNDGYAHGRIHGLIEGRALGREKGYEIWEEIGFYEGFALALKDAYDCKLFDKAGVKPMQASLSSTSLSHLRHLLELISQFPTTNPRTSQISHSSIDVSFSGPSDAISAPESEVDILNLLNSIRARYKALSTTLGVRGRVTGSFEADRKEVDEDSRLDDQAVKPPKQPVWKIDSKKGADKDNHGTSNVKAISASKLNEMSF